MRARIRSADCMKSWLAFSRALSVGGPDMAGIMPDATAGAGPNAGSATGLLAQEHPSLVTVSEPC
jgi:hypothetical protein